MQKVGHFPVIDDKESYFVQTLHSSAGRWWVVALALTHYVNLMGLFKYPIGDIQLTTFKSSLPLHCTK